MLFASYFVGKSQNVFINNYKNVYLKGIKIWPYTSKCVLKMHYFLVNDDFKMHYDAPPPRDSRLTMIDFIYISKNFVLNSRSEKLAF